MPTSPFDRSPVSRRDALRAGGVSAAAAATLAGLRAAHAENPSSDTIKVGLIGAGGRGTGALQQTLSVPGSNVKLTAVADAFQNRVDAALKSVEKMEGKVDCPEDRRFTGLDAAQKLIDLPDVDLVILATPPGFRPFHFEQAIKAGKHVFMEKPVCVDSFGARLVLEAAKLADEKKRKVVVGLQRRYENKYRETIARIREGLAGDIIGGQVYWNTGSIWYRDRQQNQTEMQFQVNNWYHFNWLSGDHICEQHVHQLDVANWVLGADAPQGYHPETAYGVGGRQDRGKNSEIYDHHAVNFSYPGGVRIASHCKQINGGEGRVNEEFQGTKGSVRIGEIKDYDGKLLWKFEGPNPNPYQVEHDELHDAIRNEKPLNNAFYGVTASFAAVLGRLATYSGAQQDYAKALAMDYRLMPENLSWEAAPPVLPDKDGRYALPMPASFKVMDVTTLGKS
jgi:myo-inositol 2-dehydrogenase/D-chiro-inositol 1-dehydrogenase